MKLRVCSFLFFLLISACSPSSTATAFPTLQPTETALAPLPSATVTSTSTPLPPTPTPCGEKSGHFERQEIQSPSLPDPLAFRVFIPPCFSSRPDQTYPVLYLLHGQGFDDGQWERLGAGDAAADLISAGEARPFLIVLPYEKNALEDPFQSGFGDAVVQNLVPWVDAHYPTCAERTCRAIGGLSRGAAWAVYLGLEHPGLFGSIGAHSLPPFLGMEKLLPKEIAAIPPGQVPRIYLDIGWGDRYRQPAAGFEAQLNRLGVPHEWYLFEGQHDEAYWSVHVRGYLEWYAAGFR